MTFLVLVNGNGICIETKIPAGGAVNLRIAGSTDVVSVQPNGTIQRRPAGSDGSFERFIIMQDGFVVVVPNVDCAIAGKLIGDPL